MDRIHAIESHDSNAHTFGRSQRMIWWENTSREEEEDCIISAKGEGVTHDVLRDRHMDMY